MQVSENPTMVNVLVCIKCIEIQLSRFRAGEICTESILRECNYAITVHNGNAVCASHARQY